MKALAENPQLVDSALILERQWRMNLIAEEERMPETLEVVRVTSEELERMERREQARLIGIEIAEILSAMFGKK